MKTRLLIIVIGIIILSSSFIIADDSEIKYVYAACAATLFGPTGPCFDSFMISHDEITEEYIMNHTYEYISVNYDNWQMSDREWSHEEDDITLDLPAIVCTEFITNGQTEYRMLKWVDSHTISSLENHRNDSLCNKWLPPISDDLPICEQNPKHDFGKCQKIFEKPNFTLKQVLDVCNAAEFVSGEQKSWWNATHFIDTLDCEYYDTVDDSPTYGQIINTKKSQVTDSDDLTDEQVCGEGLVIMNGICMPSDTFRVNDPTFFRQNLQTGETISNPEIIIMIESLGAILIVLFIIIYAIIRKRRKK